MKETKTLKYQMLTQVADFAAKYVSLFPKNTAAAQLTAGLKTALQKMSDCRATQLAAGAELRDNTKQRLSKRDALRGQVDAVHQIAVALKMDQFPLPAKPTDRALIDTANDYANKAEPLKRQFVPYGLPPDFIDQLSSAAVALAATISSRNDVRAKRTAASREFDKRLEEALDFMRLFDALVANTMAGNSTVAAAWEHATRINRTRGTAKAPSSTPDPSAPAPPAPPPTSTAPVTAA